MTTIVSQSNQLSLFNPLSQFDDRIRHETINGIIHFSILDLLEYRGSTGSSENPSKYWIRAKARMLKDGSDLPGLVDWRPTAKSGGKTTPMGTYSFCFRMSQVIEIKEWEPIRQWMAELASERVEEYHNPGLGTQRAKARDLARLKELGYDNPAALTYLETRIDGMDTFKVLMSIVKQVCDKPRYGDIVNAEYVALFGQLALGLQDILKTKNVRDALPTLQLTYIKTAEMSLAEVLSKRESVTMAEIFKLVDKVIVPLGEMLRTVCELKGVDLITGIPLLDSGD